MNLEKARFNMIEQQVKPWKVFDENLLGAMATIPREKFIPSSHQSLAYADIQIPIGHHQLMLAPREIARLIQALSLTGEEKVLDLGCGSGYACALLSRMAKQIYSVDIIEDFVVGAKKVLSQLAFNNVEIEEGDASDSWQSKAPFDAILITSAMPSLSDAFKKSLKPNGKIAAIIGTDGNYHAQIFTLNNNEWQVETLFPMNAEPMINVEQPNLFAF